MGPNDFRRAHRRRLPAHEPPCSPPPAPPRHAPAGQHGPGRAAANGHHSSRQQLGIGRRDRHWAGRDRRTIRHRAERCGHRPPRRRRARPVTHPGPGSVPPRSAASTRTNSRCPTHSRACSPSPGTARLHRGRLRREGPHDHRHIRHRIHHPPSGHTTCANFAATSSSTSPHGRAATGFRRQPRAPSPHCSPSATRSSRPSSPASAAHGWGENPRPGPDRPRLRTAPQPTGRPPSTTWSSRPRRR